MNKNGTLQKIQKRTLFFNVCDVLLLCVFRAVLSVCFCAGHFVMMP